MFIGLVSLWAALEAEITSEREWTLIDQPQAGESQKRLIYLEQRAARAKRLFLAGDPSDKEYEAKIRSLEQQRSEILGQHGMTRADGVQQMAEVVGNYGAAIQTASLEQQRVLIDAMFDRLETNGEAITRILPRHWFKDFFHKLGVIQGLVNQYPQGNSNPRRHLERVVS